jgi:hypothetical protein
VIGVVTSLYRCADPAGTMITSPFLIETGSKWLELRKQLAPRVERVAGPHRPIRKPPQGFVHVPRRLAAAEAAENKFCEIFQTPQFSPFSAAAGQNPTRCSVPECLLPPSADMAQDGSHW